MLLFLQSRRHGLAGILFQSGQRGWRSQVFSAPWLWLPLGPQCLGCGLRAVTVASKLSFTSIFNKSMNHVDLMGLLTKLGTANKGIWKLKTGGRSR